MLLGAGGPCVEGRLGHSRASITNRRSVAPSPVSLRPRANALARRPLSSTIVRRVAAPERNDAVDGDKAGDAASSPSSPLGLVAAAAASAAAPSTSAPQASSSSFSSRDDEDTDAAEGAAGGGMTSTSNSSVDASHYTADDLFDRRHLPPLNECPPDLLLYLPLGCALAATRLAAWVIAIALDLPVFRSRAAVDAYLRLLGVRVTWRHAERLPSAEAATTTTTTTTIRHVLVSNHVSVGDLMMLFAVPDANDDDKDLPPPRRRYVHLVTSALPGQVTATRNLPALLRPASRATYDRLAGAAGRDVAATIPATAKASKEEQQDGGKEEELSASVHIFPEGGMTNGRAAMLSFSRGFTRLLGGSGPNATTCVVPVALRLRTHPVARCVRSHTLTSGFLSNLFWFSFAPWTELEATALSPLAWRPAESGESRGAFVRRVQMAIAEELGVGVAEMTVQQKRGLMDEVARRRGGEEARRRSGDGAER